MALAWEHKPFRVMLAQGIVWVVSLVAFIVMTQFFCHSHCRIYRICLYVSGGLLGLTILIMLLMLCWLGQRRDRRAMLAAYGQLPSEYSNHSAPKGQPYEYPHMKSSIRVDG